jgi:hypothetical protein
MSKIVPFLPKTCHFCRMKRACIHLLLVLGCWIGFASLRAGDTTEVVRHFEREWLWYDPASGLYQPYLPGYSPAQHTLHLYEPWAFYQGYELEISTSMRCAIFLNNVFLGHTEEKWYIPVNELAAVDGRGLLSIYADHAGHRPQVRIVRKVPQAEHAMSMAAASGAQKARPASAAREAYLLMGILTLGLFAVMRHVSSLALADWQNLWRYIETFAQLKTIVKRIDNVSFLMFALLQWSSYTFVFMLLDTMRPPGEQLFEGEWGANLGRISLFTLLYIVVSTGLLQALSGLYHDRSLPNIHLQERFRIMQLYSIVILAAGLLVVLALPAWAPGELRSWSYVFALSLFGANGLVVYRVQRHRICACLCAGQVLHSYLKQTPATPFQTLGQYVSYASRCPTGSDPQACKVYSDHPISRPYAEFALS